MWRLRLPHSSADFESINQFSMNTSKYSNEKVELIKKDYNEWLKAVKENGGIDHYLQQILETYHPKHV